MAVSWNRFIGTWAGIGLAALCGLIGIEAYLWHCKCSIRILGVELQSVPPAFGAVAVGALFMVLIGLHYRQSSR
jgi:hypothetical protein